MEFSENTKSGYYREYYSSGRLRREIPFTKESESKSLIAHGIEKLFYEDKDSEGNETYTILEENLYKNGERCGIWRRYSIDGGLMEETNYDTVILPEDSNFYSCNNKEFYPDLGKLKLENNKDWGKEYYEDGSVKAEWSNKDYMKCGDYIMYYRDGNIQMRCKYLDEINRDGLMHKYFEDGTIKELWSYDKGKRIFVKKYFKNGNLKTEWLYDKNGNEISKKYYDKSGRLINK